MPTQLGAGISYVAEILILCLQAKPGDSAVIENPEIHLHPAAQSRLGAFFAFVASTGVQIILETHCEHLINRVRYEVAQGNVGQSVVKIFYKENFDDSFIKMNVDENGHFCDSNGNRVDFPKVFFDATLSELIEIG